MALWLGLGGSNGCLHLLPLVAFYIGTYAELGFGLRLGSESGVMTTFESFSVLYQSEPHLSRLCACVCGRRARAHAQCVCVCVCVCESVCV